MLEVCAILIENSFRLAIKILIVTLCNLKSSSSCVQWKDVEFINVLCLFMSPSKMAMDPNVIKILLPLAGCKIVAAEICQRVAISEFVAQLPTIQSLEVTILYFV